MAPIRVRAHARGEGQEPVRTESLRGWRVRRRTFGKKSARETAGQQSRIPRLRLGGVVGAQVGDAARAALHGRDGRTQSFRPCADARGNLPTRWQGTAAGRAVADRQRRDEATSRRRRAGSAGHAGAARLDAESRRHLAGVALRHGQGSGHRGHGGEGEIQAAGRGGFHRCGLATAAARSRAHIPLARRASAAGQRHGAGRGVVIHHVGVSSRERRPRGRAVAEGSDAGRLLPPLHGGHRRLSHSQPAGK